MIWVEHKLLLLKEIFRVNLVSHGVNEIVCELQANASSCLIRGVSTTIFKILLRGDSITEVTRRCEKLLDSGADCGQAEQRNRKWSDLPAIWGYPAIAVPRGITISGHIPFGITLIGRPFHEDDVINIANAFEKIANGRVNNVVQVIIWIKKHR